MCYRRNARQWIHGHQDAAFMVNQEADQIHGGAWNGVLSRDDAVFRDKRLRKKYIVAWYFFV